MTQTEPAFGGLIQTWRRQRRRSQLALALEAGISQRHLSFLESGRSRPSRDMVLLLAEHLSVPLRERNVLLTAAGFAPAYRERGFDHPDLAAAREAVEAIVQAHDPHPALGVDRHWNLVVANRAVSVLLRDVDPALLAPPVNVLKLSLDPRGLGSRIANFGAWRAHVLARLAQQVDASGDAGLSRLHDEIRALPLPPRASPRREETGPAIAVPFRLEVPGGTLDFISTTTVFGTAVDVTLAELTIETFFPANRETAAAMRALVAD